MTRAILLFALALSFGLGAGFVLDAQTILLKTGQTAETLGVRRAGDTVMGKIKVGNSSGEVGYQVSTIAKIDFPEPKGLKNAEDFLTQGQPDKALAEIEAVVKFYAPFRDIPGAWWAPAALIRVSALAGLKRDAEAEALAREIQKDASADPESARAATLRVVNGLTRKEDFSKALEICDGVIKESAKPEVLADAWVNKGNVLFAQKQWEGALMAYLHVPIFYPQEKLFMPSALLGSGRAYRRLDDLERAKKSFKELADTFPKSTEASLAQAEVQKIK